MSASNFMNLYVNSMCFLNFKSNVWIIPLLLIKTYLVEDIFFISFILLKVKDGVSNQVKNAGNISP